MAVGQNQWYHVGVGAPPILCSDSLSKPKSVQPPVNTKPLLRLCAWLVPPPCGGAGGRNPRLLPISPKSIDTGSLGPPRVRKASPTGENAKTTCTLAFTLAAACGKLWFLFPLFSGLKGKPQKLPSFKTQQLLGPSAQATEDASLDSAQVGAEDVGFGRRDASLRAVLTWFCIRIVGCFLS